MATAQKISELTTAGPLTGAELVPIVQNGGTLQTTVSVIAAFAVVSLAPAVSALATQVTNIANQVGAETSLINVLTNDLNALEIQVAAVSALTSVNIAAITSINNTVSALEIRVSAASATGSTNSAAITSINAVTSSLTVRVSALEAAISIIGDVSAIAALTSTVAILDADVSALEIRMAAVSAATSVNSAAITSINAVVSTKADRNGDFLTNVQYIDFNTTTSYVPAPGRLTWDIESGTLDLGLTGTVNLLVGQRTVAQVFNNSGVTLPRGKAVRVTGAQGQRLTGALALADSDANSLTIFGIMLETVSVNNSGYVATDGLIRNFNTSGFADGDVIYLSPVSAGELTPVKPVSPQHLVQMGYIVNGGSVGAGEIYVKVQNGYELGELHDVKTSASTSLADGEVLAYNVSAQVWTNSPALINAQASISALNIQVAAVSALTSVNAAAITSINSVVSAVQTQVNATVSVDRGGTGATSLTANNVILGNGASAVQFVAPGTTGNVLTSNGTTWVSQASSASLLGDTDSATPFETALGFEAGNVNTGVNNTFIGYQAGLLNTTGTNNTAVGYQALDSNTTGIQNIAIGSLALAANTTASNNIAIGHAALDANTIGTPNIAIGTNALGANTTGTDNVAIGSQALGVNTIGISNVAIGTDALGVNTTGRDNVAIGTDALDANTVGVQNIAIGSNALGVNTTASNNIAIGHAALDANTTGTPNLAIGTNALGANTVGTNNIAIGNDALLVATASNNLAIGSAALDANTTGTPNIAIGNNALTSNTVGTDNVAIGSQALGVNTIGTANLAIGVRALEANTTGTDNLAIGLRALDTNTTGVNNLAIGTDALGVNSIGTANLAIGVRALEANTTGINNVAIGYQAGNTITTGTGNTIIGANADPSVNNAVNQIVIGSDVVGQANSNVTIGSNAGKIYNAFTTNATWTQTSDGTLKDVIGPDTLGLSFVNRLRPITFRWKPQNELPVDHPYYNEVNNRDIETVIHGFVAQEVKQALDAEGCSTFNGWDEGPDGIQAISREMFISPLVKAIQELNVKIEELQQQILNLSRGP